MAIPARWVVGIAAAVAVGALTWTMPATGPSPDAVVPVAQDGPRVAMPWIPGRPQLGVQVYWHNNPEDTVDVVRAKARRVLDHAIGLEANSVIISFPFFSPTITANRVEGDVRTPSPDRLGILLDEADRAGLRITLRPLLDETALTQRDERDWRGRLDPIDRDEWYASYQAFLNPYLRLAQARGVETVIIGTELTSLQNDPHWADVVRASRELYSGELGYSANWDAYREALAGLPVDVVGIDAYPQLDLGPNSDDDAIADAFGEWLDNVGPAEQRPETHVLHELGGAAESELFENPANPERPGTELDQDIQRRWFAAACAEARERRLAGFYWWRIDFDTDPGAARPLTDRHDSFIGRSAEQAMRDCFAGWGAAP